MNFATADPGEHEGRCPLILKQATGSRMLQRALALAD